MLFRSSLAPEPPLSNKVHSVPVLINVQNHPDDPELDPPPPEEPLEPDPDPPPLEEL